MKHLKQLSSLITFIHIMFLKVNFLKYVIIWDLE